MKKLSILLWLPIAMPWVGCESDIVRTQKSEETPVSNMACSPGDMACKNDVLLQCVQTGGMTAWQSVTPCLDGCNADKTACMPADTEPCDIGEKRCVDAKYQRCVRSPQGSGMWQSFKRCENGCNVLSSFCLSSPTLDDNPTRCTVMAQKCEDGLLQRCLVNAEGMAVWTGVKNCDNDCNDEATACHQIQPCGAGDVLCADFSLYQCIVSDDGSAQWRMTAYCEDGCSGDGKAACAQESAERDECVEYAQKCEDGKIYLCKSDETGKLSFQFVEDCQSATCLDNGAACGTSPACSHACQQQDARTCSDDAAVQVCRDDNGDGCLEWVTEACADGETCREGKCGSEQTCVSVCGNGETRCSGSRVQICRDVNGDGCLEWEDGQVCDGGCANGACRPKTWVPECSGAGCPTVLKTLGKTISGDTSKGVKKFETYACDPTLKESGPEQSYVFKVDEPGYVIVNTTEPSGGDVDVHLLRALDAGKCLARADKRLFHHVDAGIYYVVVDTYQKEANAGAYKLTVSFLADSGKCALKPTSITRVGSCSTANLPALTQAVEEAHLVTDWDRANNFGNGWPSSKTDWVSKHVAHTKEITGGWGAGKEWCPNGEGGCQYGQGSTANQVPAAQEAWYINMYWNSKGKPKAGTKFLVVNPANGRAVVASAGWETGPGNCDYLCGTVYEIHQYLGTNHRGWQFISLLKNQDIPYGPVDCLYEVGD